MDDELIEVEILDPPRPAQPRRGPVLIDLTSDASSPPTAARHTSPRPPRRAGPSPTRGRGRGATADDEVLLPRLRNTNNSPVIDLTGEDASSPPGHARPPYHHNQPPAARRGRSSSIDPDDIIILRSHTHTHTHTHTTNARDRDRERQRLRATLFPGLASYFPPLPEHMRTLFQEFTDAGAAPVAAAAGAHRHHHQRNHHARAGAPPHFDPLVHLNYQRAAFGHHHHHHHHHNAQPPPPAAPAAATGLRPKVEMPPAREGFTRDTGEELVVVCPACGGELEYDPARSEGKKKKRDKGEHHFWAVKACGHVYCQPCFDNKRPTAKNKSNFRALDGTPNPAPQSKILCAVDECPSDVTNKGSWVGIYL